MKHKKIERISVRMYPSEEKGLFHDSRGDVRKLGKAVNILIDKVNELVDENNRLKEQLAELSTPVKSEGEQN